MKTISNNVGRSMLFGLYWLFGMMLPKHMKRMLFTTTLHLKLMNENVMQDETFRKLNAKMGLANNDLSLKAMGVLGKNVLNDAVVTDFINEHRNELAEPTQTPSENTMTQAVKVFIEKWPKAYRYGENAMASDIRRLVTPTKAERV